MATVFRSKYVEAFLFFFALVVIVVLATFLVDNVIEIPGLSLATLSNVVSILGGLLTLALALLIYRKFTGTQLLIDRQTEQVMLLIDQISSMHFAFVINDKPRSPESMYITNIYLDETHIDGKNVRTYLDNEFKGYKFIADKDTLRFTDYLMEKSFELYLPKTIAKLLDHHFNRATPWWLDSADKMRSRKFINISLDGKEYRLQDKSSYYMKYIVIDPVKLSEALEECYAMSVKWMEENNNDVFEKLNIKLRGE